MKTKILFLALLLTTFMGIDSYQGIDAFRFGKVRYALLFGCVLLFLKLKKYYGIGISAFVAYAAAQMILFNYPLYGYFDTSLVVFIPLIPIAIKENISTKFFVNTVVWVGAFQSVIGILQFFGIHFLWFPANRPSIFDHDWGALNDWHEVCGTLGQHTILGSFLALCLAPALWCKNWLASILIFTCIILTRSSMSIGCAIVVSGLYLCYRFKPKFMFYFWCGVAAIGFTVWWNFPDLYFGGTKHSLFKLLGRDKIWPIAWELFKQQPYLGRGVGFWALWSEKNIGLMFGGGIWDKVHSEPLQMLVEQGLIGASFCLYAAYEFIRSFKLTWHHALVVGLLVNSLANFPFHLMGHAILFCVAWILCMEAMWKKKDLLV